jgi:dipeptidyl aminopeptidase/acylaminoacyl peptidase
LDRSTSRHKKIPHHRWILYPNIGPVAGWLGKPALEAPELVKKANPMTYIDSSDPPVLIMHGEKDSLVPIAQSELFYDALTKAGVKAKLVRVQNAGHGFNPDPQGSTISPSADEITATQMNWFKEVLK